MRRLGRKKIPVFSIIATDSRNARDGRYIEDLGRYYPLKQPAEVQLNEDRVLYWLDNGAKPSDTVRSILSKRGLMLYHHLKLKGTAEADIREQVNKHLKQVAEKGDAIAITSKMQPDDALEEERERAEQRRKEAEERRLREAAVPLHPDTEEESDDAEADDDAEASDDAADADADDDADAHADADANVDADADDDESDEGDETADVSSDESDDADSSEETDSDDEEAKEDQ